MNKRDLVEAVAERTGLPPADVADVVEAFMAIVASAVVRGDRVVLQGFGTFRRRARAARVARDLRTGRPVRVRARDVPAFRPGKAFGEAVGRARRRTGRARRGDRAQLPSTHGARRGGGRPGTGAG